MAPDVSHQGEQRREERTKAETTRFLFILAADISAAWDQKGRVGKEGDHEDPSRFLGHLVYEGPGVCFHGYEGNMQAEKVSVQVYVKYLHTDKDVMMKE